MAKSRSTSANSRRSKDGKGIWAHPLTILAISTLIGLLGWGARTWYIDRGGLDAHLTDTHEVGTLPSTLAAAPSPALPAVTKRGPSTSMSPASDAGKTANVASGAPKPVPLEVAAAQTVKVRGVPAPLISTTPPEQAIALAVQKPPNVLGHRLFCDTLKTTLVINYAAMGSRAVAVTGITLNMAPLEAPEADGCRIDPLSSQPRGITLRDAYIFTLRDRNSIGKYIMSGKVGDAVDVSLTNILETTSGTQTISLKPNDEPVVRDVYINSVASRPMKIWFTIHYDAGGERSLETLPVYLAKAQ